MDYFTLTLVVGGFLYWVADSVVTADREKENGDGTVYYTPSPYKSLIDYLKTKIQKHA